jgi:hypothetical protein
LKSTIFNAQYPSFLANSGTICYNLLMKTPKNPWKNRIVGYGEENPNQLLANEANWRIHPRAQQNALGGVLREVGIVQNVIVNLRKGPEWPDEKRGISTVVDGHARISLAISDRQPSIPITYVELSPSEEAEILATLDPISAMAVADSDMLNELLKSVSTDNSALQEMLSDLAKNNGIDIGPTEEKDAEPKIDLADELQKIWKTETGQLWKIGEHRLLIGDCTSPPAISALLDNYKLALVLTDPPYNVGLDYDNKTVDDNRAPEDYGKFCHSWMAELQKICEHIIVTPGGNNLEFWMREFPPYCMAPRILPNTQSPGRISQFAAWEPILFFGKKWGRKRHLDFFEFSSNFNSKKQTFNHPCPKPVPLWQDLIENYTERNDVVYDCFAGSGTALVACQNTERISLAMEISPGYAAVCLQRMKDAFNITGELVETL